MDTEPKKENAASAEWEKARQEALALKEQIFHELDRIGNMNDDALYDRLWNEVFNPPLADQATIRKCAVFHIVTGSSITYEDRPQIDLPGPDNLMAFYTKKLAELREIKNGDASS